jgi:hypothetical protein
MVESISDIEKSRCPSSRCFIMRIDDKMQSTAAVQYSTDDMQIHILSFEGPDGYARAGGIASRITGLSESLAEAGSAA